MDFVGYGFRLGILLALCLLLPTINPPLALLNSLTRPFFLPRSISLSLFFFFISASASLLLPSSSPVFQPRCPLSSSALKLARRKLRMTNPNVVVSDTKSTINMAITVTVSNSSIFPPTAQKPPAGPSSGYISISRSTKLLQDGTWVDSMRASSPSRIKSTCSLSDDQDSWMLHHPSALDMFEQIIDASKGKQIVMFLDYDGTLSPIVDDPDRAFMSDAMRKTVKKVARSFPTAIVSGRRRDKVYSFVRLGELYYAGSHGMDIKGPTKDSNYKKCTQSVLFQPASEFLPMIDEVYKQLVEKTKSTPGAKVENNKFCLSVHFRCVEEKKWSELAQQVKSVLKDYPELRLTQGRKVLEIRPTIKWDKGKALEFLLESLGFANCSDVFPVYIGDDRTDEDAFKIIRERGQGFGILVSKFPKETSATYSLREPSEVMYFLQRLAEWKKRPPLPGQCEM